MWPGSEFEKVRSMLCQIVVKWRLKLYSVEMSWWRCETGKRLLSFAQGSLHEFSGICRELEFYCFWKRETVCLWNLKLETCEFVFVWFSFMWTVICGVCCRCRAFMLATVDLMTCLRVIAQTTLTSWPFHVCIPCPWQLFVLVWLLIH